MAKKMRIEDLKGRMDSLRSYHYDNCHTCGIGYHNPTSQYLEDKEFGDVNIPMIITETTCTVCGKVSKWMDSIF